jgi:hypothetical protein
MRFWTIIFLIATLCFALGGCLLCIGSPVTLAWNASTDPIVAGYNVYYGGARGTYTNKVNVGAATSVTISNLTPAVTYYFAATTYSSAGVESVMSAELAYQMPAATTNQVTTVTARLVQFTTSTNCGGTWTLITNIPFTPPLLLAAVTNMVESSRFWRGVVVLDISQTNK